MIKNSTFDVYDRMDKKALETMAAAFESDYAVAASIQGVEFIKVRLSIIYALLKYKIHKDWLPTPENINSMPEPVRKYIHDIETNCDPAHLVQENVLLKDTCRGLVLKLEKKKSKLDIEIKARELFAWSADPRTIKECEEFIRAIVKEIQAK